MTGAIPFHPGGETGEFEAGALPRAGRASGGARSVARPETLSDAALLARARSGDRRAFGALVERHHDSLHAILRQKLGPGAPLEDLLQEVFARTLAHLDGFREGSSFVTWATSIGLHLAIDWRRKRTRRRELVPTTPYEQDVAPERRRPGVVETVALRDEAARARAALSALPERQRLAVTLRVVQDLPYDEVARRLGAPVPRVRTWVSRGLRRLRDELDGSPGGSR